ncbi:neuron navigator 3-like [Styela clava]
MIRPGLRWRSWQANRHLKPIKVVPPNTFVCLKFTEESSLGYNIKAEDEAKRAFPKEDAEVLFRWFEHLIDDPKKKVRCFKDASKLLTDGITLMKCVQKLANVKISGIYNKPFFKWQKVHNTTRTLQFLVGRGLTISECQQRGIEIGDSRSVLEFLKKLQDLFSNCEKHIEKKPRFPSFFGECFKLYMCFGS